MVDFTHVDTFVFDLDNTLYPAECHLFAQIDQKMTSFIETQLSLAYDEARYLQKHYYAVYGTTLSGLMKEHKIDPEKFMDYVHDIDLTVIMPDPHLTEAIGGLPGKRYIFTNGSVKHAENVTTKLGILDLFDGIFDIQMAGFTPKPHAEAYNMFTDHFDISPTSAAMIEDIPENLRVPHEMGLSTVLVQSDAAWFADEPACKQPARAGEEFDFVHHITQDLAGFLKGLNTAA